MLRKDNNINKTTTKEVFFNFLRINIPLTDDEFKDEYDFLLSLITGADTLPKLDGIFEDIKRHIKFRFDSVKKFSQSTSVLYIKKYRSMFIDLKAGYEAKKENIKISDKLFYREGIVDGASLENLDTKIPTKNHTGQRNFSIGKMVVAVCAFFFLGAFATTAINEMLGHLFICLFIIIGIVFGAFILLKKDYRRYKEASKMWVFILEVILAIIFIPVILRPIYESLIGSLLIFLK